jgi:hypothetical protein
MEGKSYAGNKPVMTEMSSMTYPYSNNGHVNYPWSTIVFISEHVQVIDALLLGDMI